MNKDIKVGDTAKFEGTVKDIQYNSDGVPSGYVVADDANGVGSLIPASVTDKVNIHPELPEAIGRHIHNIYGIMGSTDKDYVTFDTGLVSYVDFLVDLINVIDNDADYNWVKDNESDLYNAYTYGYTVAQDTTKYFYPVPYTNGFYYTHPDQVDHSTLLGTVSRNDEPDRDFAFIYPNAVWTKEQLSARGTILSDVIEAEVNY